MGNPHPHQGNPHPQQGNPHQGNPHQGNPHQGQQVGVNPQAQQAAWQGGPAGPAGPIMAPQPIKKTSGLAVAGLVLGILAILTCFLPIINNASFVMGLVGVVMAIVAFLGARKGKNTSKGMAIAGIVLNVLAIVITLFMQEVYSRAWNQAVNEATTDAPVSSSTSGETTTSDSSTTSDTSATSDDSSAETAEGQAADAIDYQHLAMGEGATFDDGLTVTVNSVDRSHTDYSGDAVTWVNVTYVNNGSESASFNIFDWKGEDASGVQRNIALTSGDDEDLGSGTLSPGGTVTGTVYLQGDDVRIIYQHNIFLEDSQVAWDVE
jgi:hypothetical protein